MDPIRPLPGGAILNPDTLDDWYTAAKAAEVLSRKSKRVVRPSYLRSLTRLGKITTKQLGKRVTLYLKKDIDSYIVEPRGTKSGRAMRAHRGKQEKEAA
jgi:hypothetical protein